MESFAAVIRTLLARIRAVPTWPPSAAAAAEYGGSIYRVRPTAWGVGDPPEPRPEPVGQNERARPSARNGSESSRRARRLRAFALPAPRGLLAT